jgi:hypothetical protein
MKTTSYLNKHYRDDEIQQMLLYCFANDSMNKGTIRKTLLDFERRTILSPHSDSLKIHAIILDE